MKFKTTHAPPGDTLVHQVQEGTTQFTGCKQKH